MGPILLTSPSGGFLGATFIKTLLFPLKSWSAEDRVVLGCSPRHFGLSPFVLGTHPPWHGPRALIERGSDHKFPGPTAYFSFYTSLYPLSNVHVWVRFSRTDTCPISPYPKWLGVVVKAEEHSSVRCKVFNGSNGSFPFVLGRHTVQRSFLYQHRYFRFFPKLFLYRSCPFFQEYLEQTLYRLQLFLEICTD